VVGKVHDHTKDSAAAKRESQHTPNLDLSHLVRDAVVKRAPKGPRARQRLDLGYPHRGDVKQDPGHPEARGGDMLRAVSVKLGPGEKVIFKGHPSWRSILDFYLKGAVVLVVVAALVALVSQLVGDEVDWALVGIVLIVGAAIGVLAGFIKRVATRYTITNKRLNVKHGIISRDVQETRLERVQDVRYSQSVIQRLLQIGDVDFDTAADDPTSFVFAGVGSPREIVELVNTASSGPSGLGDPESEPQEDD
jgi:membrane protein YdbS with pleckstrin-like domain